MDSQQQFAVQKAYENLLKERDRMIENLSGVVGSRKERTVWVDSLIMGVMAAMMRSEDFAGEDAKNYAEELPRKIATLCGAGSSGTLRGQPENAE